MWKTCERSALRAEPSVSRSLMACAYRIWERFQAFAIDQTE
jgi:hypothetical protein